MALPATTLVLAARYGGLAKPEDAARCQRAERNLVGVRIPWPPPLSTLIELERKVSYYIG